MRGSDLKFVQDLVRSEAAIVLDDNKEYLVRCRLSTLCRKESYVDIPQMLRAAQGARSRTLRMAIVDAMTTNETSFFRDDVPWQALREEVLPALVERNKTTRRLNIWSAACSTGQEPYTVAMILEQCFPQLRDWRVDILATDLSPTVLEKAKRGRYLRFEIGRGLDPVLRDRYFSEVEGTQWQIDPAIRSMVEFRQLNLASSFAGLPVFDLVLIRNVLIYFDLDTKRDILARVQRQMAKDAFLLLGSGETTLNMGLQLTRKRHRRAWFYENG